MILSIIVLVVFIIMQSKTNDRVTQLENKLRTLETGNVPITPTSVSPLASASAPIVNIEPQATFVAPLPPKREFQEEHLGRTLGIIGVFAVLFGIGFFLKYAFDNNLIGITGRLLLGAFVGILGVVLGRLIQAKYEKYSHILSGGGIGILFVTTFTACTIYHVISAPIAYAIFVGITALSVILSVLDKRMLLAGIGIAGGFIAPLLIPYGDRESMSLLSYILILNVGVFAIAFKYRWLQLQYISFIGTIITVLTEYSRSGQTDDHLMVFFFASIYFAIFLASSVFHHIVRKESSDQGDLFFATANAGLYAFFAYAVLHPLMPESMGLFMLGLAIVYFILGYLSFSTNKQDKLLNIALPLIGAVFFTIAIPLHFDGRWITTAWLIEAVCLALIDYAIFGRRLYVYAVVVYMIGVFKLFAVDSFQDMNSAFVPVFNGRCALFVFATACGLAIAYAIQKSIAREPQNENNSSLGTLSVFVGTVSQVVWLFIITSEIHRFIGLNYAQEKTVISIVWALYAAFITIVGFVAHIRSARVLGIILFVITAIKIFFNLWALGPLYRIVSSIIFGVIALAASFLYAKYKDRLKDVL